MESGIATAAVWRDDDALVGSSHYKLLSSVGASPRYIRWNKVSAPTCLLSANGWMVCLLREASGTADLYHPCTLGFQYIRKVKMCMNGLNVIPTRVLSAVAGDEVCWPMPLSLH